MGLLCALAQLFLKGVYGGDEIDTTASVVQELGKMHVV